MDGQSLGERPSGFGFVGEMRAESVAFCFEQAAFEQRTEDHGLDFDQFSLEASKEEPEFLRLESSTGSTLANRPPLK